ncbi:MAG TPA: ABC transporter permease [Acidimicrobiales bacterium]|nr:ABC transporter permease [Acidimicrobiales bacterium]
MTAATIEGDGRGPDLRAAAERLWGHRFLGPALKLVLAYLLLIEGVVQLVFGRLQVLGLDVGLQSNDVPREIFLNGAAIGMLYALLGMGLILVYRANRIINFAQAQLGSVPAVTALLVMLRKDVNYFLVLPIVIFGAVVLGAIVQKVFIWWRLKDAPRLIVTVATIAVSLLLVGLELFVQDLITGSLVSSDTFTTPWTKYGFDTPTLRITGDYLVAAVVTIAICIALGAFFKYTDMGIAIRASAENGERASLLGIPIARVSTVVWIIAAVMSAIAVFLRAPVSGLTLGSSVGPSVLLFGLAAAVIARMESLPMCVAAGIGIGIVDQSALFGTRRSSLAIATMLVVILVALLAQRGRMARALDAGVSTWQAAKEYRPIPFELRNVREVILSRGALANLVLFVTVVFPLIADSKYAGRFTIVVITAMVGVSLVMLTGWAGQISLGQFGFAGIGALVTAGMAVRGWDFFACLAMAGLLGAVAAVLIGLPALRIQGPFLAVTTLSFAFTVQYFFLNPSYFDWWLPASGEFVTRPKLYGFFSTTSDIRYYFVCLTFLVMSLLLARSMRRNRFGRILIGVRDNSKGVQAYGVSVARTKLAAFAISGFVAAVAGGLFTYYLQSVDATVYNAARSINVFTVVVIGGLTSLPGALLGATYVEGIPFLLNGNEMVRLFTSSIGLLLLLMFRPDGLSGIAYGWRDQFLRWSARRNGIHVPSLLADSLVVETAATDHALTDAVERIDEAETPPEGEHVRCPVCRRLVAVADVTEHEHFKVEAGV